MKTKHKNKYGDYTDLDIWKMGHDLRIKVGILIRYLPNYERYNVISQIRRSSCSISSNIAEGHGRYHYQENIQYCRQARGSLDETRDHLIYIKDCGYINKISSIEHLIEICKQLKIKLNAYISYLKRKQN